jgi:hypothetical protein
MLLQMLVMCGNILCNAVAVCWPDAVTDAVLILLPS